MTTTAICCTKRPRRERSPAERKAIQQQAKDIRNDKKNYQSVVTPLVFQSAAIETVINKAVQTRGYMTASEWNSALSSSKEITTTTNDLKMDMSTAIITLTTTTTTIGRTNLAVNSRGITPAKSTNSISSTGFADISLSYNVTKDEAKFVSSVADESVSLEQVLVILDTLERNNGNITKQQLTEIGVKVYGGYGGTIDSIEMAYDFSQKGMTTSEAQILYQQEIINQNLQAAWGIIAFGAAGGFRIGSSRVTPSSSVAVSKPASVQSARSIGTVGAQRRTDLASPGSNGASTNGTELPADAVIVRGGMAKPGDLINNQKMDTKSNTLSANGGWGVSNETLSAGLKNNQISVVSVGKLNDAGYKVVATPTANNPYHVSIYTPGGAKLSENEAARLSSQFTQFPNPTLNR